MSAGSRSLVNWMRRKLTPLAERRLQDDRLLDTADQRLRAERSALRVRTERGASRVTFKGPIRPAAMKLREEIETSVGDADTMLRLLGALGFRPWFRYQKFREEFRSADVVVAIDETPIGTFVEIVGTETGIDAVAKTLGRTRSDYILESYYGLFDAWRRSTGFRRARHAVRPHVIRPPAALVLDAGLIESTGKSSEGVWWNIYT